MQENNIENLKKSGLSESVADAQTENSNPSGQPSDVKENRNDASRIPDPKQIEAEIKRVRHKRRFRQLIRSTAYTIVVVSAVAVLIAVLFMPVYRTYGNSMNPTLTEGEIIVSVKNAEIKTGDVVGVYVGSKLLIKRCIAVENQWVDIDRNGNVFVDGEPLDEPYVSEKALGECNIELPYQVPVNGIFVMGDHRATSVDSRNTSVGCIDREDIGGKIVFRVWPLKAAGKIK